MSDDDWTEADAAAWAALMAEVSADECALLAMLARAQTEQPSAGWAIDHHATASRPFDGIGPSLGELLCEVESPGGAIRLWATRPRWAAAGKAAQWIVRVFEPPGPEHRAATLPEATAAAVGAERARREALARAWLGGAP